MDAEFIVLLKWRERMENGHCFSFSVIYIVKERATFVCGTFTVLAT